jgi:hypothetical protein
MAPVAHVKESAHTTGPLVENRSLGAPFVMD